MNDLTEDLIALHAGILAAPDDDATRFVYADALDDSGLPFSRSHAELIRWQVARPEVPATFALAATDRVTNPSSARQAVPSYPSLVFAARMARCLLPGVKRIVTVRRGFVESVCCPLASWLSGGTTIAARHPVVKVETSDRAARREKGADEAETFWWTAEVPGEEPQACDLPQELWDALAPSPYVWRWHGAYPTRRDANAALGEAMLRQAKTWNLNWRPTDFYWLEYAQSWLTETT